MLFFFFTGSVITSRWSIKRYKVEETPARFNCHASRAEVSHSFEIKNNYSPDSFVLCGTNLRASAHYIDSLQLDGSRDLSATGGCLESRWGGSWHHPLRFGSNTTQPTISYCLLHPYFLPQSQYNTYRCLYISIASC